MTSKTDNWTTPQHFFNEVNKEFNFELDVCASKENAKCSSYFDKKADGLSQAWAPRRCWLNPPYGKDVGKWIEKAYRESQLGALVVCLIFARTDTKWFHDWGIKGEIRFIKGRLKFGGSKNSAPAPSILIIFRPKTDGR